MTPYVFHCTPCGHPHAGECPPTVAGKLHTWTAAQVDVTAALSHQHCSTCGKRWFVSLATVVGAHPNVPTPPAGPCPGIPKVGSLWKLEVKARLGWTRQRLGYEVVKSSPTELEVQAVLTGSIAVLPGPYKVPIGAWTEDGVDWFKFFSGAKIRFVPPA